jgi:hypothetical protein
VVVVVPFEGEAVEVEGALVVVVAAGFLVVVDFCGAAVEVAGFLVEVVVEGFLVVVVVEGFLVVVVLVDLCGDLSATDPHFSDQVTVFPESTVYVKV